MRSPDEQERFLTSERFDNSSAYGRSSMETVAIVALVYWILAGLAFLFNFWAGFLATLPLSYLIVSARMHLLPSNPSVEFISNEGQVS